MTCTHQTAGLEVPAHLSAVAVLLPQEEKKKREEEEAKKKEAAAVEEDDEYETEDVSPHMHCCQSSSDVMPVGSNRIHHTLSSLS